jgi:hypothetical protein
MKVTEGVYIRKKSVWNCVLIVCGIVGRLYVELLEDCMWNCWKIVCGIVERLYVELLRDCEVS